jgi:DNA-binding NarL/FixJ family response regulator
VLVVDDHRLMLEHVARVVCEEFTVAALVCDVTSLMHAWQDARPDVVVMDISLGDGNGFDAAGLLRAAGCGVPIVFLSMHEAPEFVRAAWHAGGIGYVAKRDVGRALVPALQAALRGRRYLSPAIVALQSGREPS